MPAHRRSTPTRTSSDRSTPGMSPSSATTPRHRTRTTVVAVVTGVATACIAVGVIGHAELSTAAAQVPPSSAGTSPATTPRANAPASSSPSASPSSTPATTTLPGVGPVLSGQIPADSTQAVVAYGDSVDSSNTTVVFYQKGAAGWQQVASWTGHNGDKGWTEKHMQGDLRTQIGVFGLTDAGGLLPNPGSQLPYYRSSEFVASGVGFDGESLAKAFDYVIAINYNRVTGTSPLDTREPMGAARGGGIWLHVDHGGPTHACVSLPAQGMVMLLRELSPSQHPVIVMGDRADLAR